MGKLFLLPGLLLIAVGAQAGVAQARTGPCLGAGQGGPTCHFSSAKVTEVGDGDTIRVRVNGRGPQRDVRFIGIQAMELHKYGKPSAWAGECHAVAAARRVLQLVRASHWRVRLSSENPASKYHTRIGRWIGVKVNARWRDLGETLMAEGLTLWFPNGHETAWNDRYELLGQEAALKGIGMWNTSTCGSGPDQNVPLQMWVNWDPPGVDTLTPNAEWIKIRNLSASTPVPLGGWWLRDSDLRRFTFPRGTMLAPNSTITVHPAGGQSSPGIFYWGTSGQVFQNTGDGAYLFDPQGDLRRWMLYRCRVACTDPNQGAVQLTPQLRGAQYVRLTNVSNHPVDLYGYILEKLGRPYDFGPNSVLQPGQTMQVDVEGDPSQDTQFERHWGMDHSILRARGDAVKVLTFTDITVACTAWGDSSC
jgi:endonuclease YncB( thermonuclease family)